MNTQSLLEYTQRKWLFLSWDYCHKAELRHDGLNYRLELPRTRTRPAVKLELLSGTFPTRVQVTTETDSWTAFVHFHPLK